MNEQNKNDNAANRKSYVGDVFNIGEKVVKKGLLNKFDKQTSDLHKKGYIHIHDLDAYNYTYNCLTFDILQAFPYEKFAHLDDFKKIVYLFGWLKDLFEKMGNEQSGGMALANFDNELAEIFTKLKINYENYKELISACILDLIIWNNENHTRMGQTSYYVSFNIGLAKNKCARFFAKTLINEFKNAGDLIFKPNIIFKVKKGINFYPSDKNYDLLKEALLCTCLKMIPTYILCDSEVNIKYNPNELGIVGCRTKVVDNLFVSKKTAIGRGNIANISINLPRIALETVVESKTNNIDNLISRFKSKWEQIANICKQILLNRFYTLCKVDKTYFPTNLTYNLWIKDFKNYDLETIFKNGTLSIGFIGLSEAFEILTKTKYWKNEEIYHKALDFVKFMRNITDKFLRETNLNFSLLATSGELISGRFIDIDKKIFKGFDHIFKKGFYTNSFHIEVDSCLPAYQKIQFEGPFHLYSNGGCITYVELNEAPIGNYLGLYDLIEVAIKSSVHYLGFNFPKDVCNKCGSKGVFDKCFKCNSEDITRIRRVSGYLEKQNYFTAGKYKESITRKSN